MTTHNNESFRTAAKRRVKNLLLIILLTKPSRSHYPLRRNLD